jgi:ubiquinone/menaquinone biosynthesis C-methylase UbiE
MNIAPPTDTLRQVDLRDTREAFDSVAADYDGARGNNLLIQDMRHEMWRWLDATFAPGSRLIDLGCGTGLDAIRLAKQGHHVTATDWSPRMVERTRDRAVRESVTQNVRAIPVGAHELERLEADEPFDGAYSNLGPLNCVPDMTAVAAQCARLIKPGGALVFTVIGRICPWEIVHFGLKRNWERLRVRFSAGMEPVRMNKRTVWTRYYSPREFYRAFQREFRLGHCRGVCVFAPPPYMTSVRERHPHLYRWLWQLDRKVTGWPLLRSTGDHFLMVMLRRREAQ